MTGDEQLQQKLVTWADRFNRHSEAMTTVEIDQLMALIRQDRRELLERLKAQKVGYMDGGEWDAIPIDVINAELQHGAESGEADHE